jgi:uncharacterized protein YndB with AHSA1/START domain
MIPDQIEREIVIAAPPERVWAAITEAEHLGAWFADSGAEVDLRPGGTLLLRWRDHGESRTVIERIEPGRRFAWRWTHAAETEPTPANSTLVEFTLTPEGAGTRLRVVESGFHALDLPAEKRAERFAENSAGWRDETAELRTYLERRAA